MICYRDMTFCASPNCINECGRKLTDEMRCEYVLYTIHNPDFDIPLSTAYFCGEPSEAKTDD